MSGLGEEIDMDAAVARLKASKEQHREEQLASGRENGKKWAAKTAETHELEALREFAGVQCRGGCVVTSHDVAALFPDFDLWEQVLGSSENLPSDAYVEGFVDAATDMLIYAESKF